MYYVHTYVQYMNRNMVYMYSNMRIYMPYVCSHNGIVYNFLV